MLYWPRAVSKSTVCNQLSLTICHRDNYYLSTCILKLNTYLITNCSWTHLKFTLLSKWSINTRATGRMWLCKYGNVLHALPGAALGFRLMEEDVRKVTQKPASLENVENKDGKWCILTVFGTIFWNCRETNNSCFLICQYSSGWKQGR